MLQCYNWEKFPRKSLVGPSSLSALFPNIYCPSVSISYVFWLECTVTFLLIWFQSAPQAQIELHQVTPRGRSSKQGPGHGALLSPDWTWSSVPHPHLLLFTMWIIRTPLAGVDTLVPGVSAPGQLANNGSPCNNNPAAARVTAVHDGRTQPCA